MSWKIFSSVWLVAVVSAYCVEAVDLVPQQKRAWDFEYGELTGQIERLKQRQGVSRDRLKVETLDEQALILPDDQDPVDVVIRRSDCLASGG
jgi:hypothetical protein